LNLEKVLLGHVSRLRYITRCSGCFTVHKESVAEHSYYTTLYAMLIMQYLAFDETAMLTGLMKAVVHDTEECRTGDIPRPFKYSNEAMRKHIEDAGRVASEQVLDEWFDGDREDTRWCELSYCWAYAKDDTPPGWVVGFSDYLSVLSYAAQEILNGNRTLFQHMGGIETYHEHFEQSKLPFEGVQAERARGLVQQAGAIVRRLAGCRESAAEGS